MSICNEDMQKTPVGCSMFFLEQIMQPCHEVVAVEEGVPHGSATMWMDIPYLARSGWTGGLFEATGSEGDLWEEMGMIAACIGGGSYGGIIHE